MKKKWRQLNGFMGHQQADQYTYCRGPRRRREKEKNAYSKKQWLKLL